MGVIVGSGYVWVECNWCHATSAKHRPEPNGQHNVREWVEVLGWSVSYITGNAMCPQCKEKEAKKNV